MPLTPGTRLGPYEILAVAGTGGMGEVYRARDTRLGREVAIKVLPQHLSHDPARRERFEREARAVSALNHPHICVLYDIGSEGGADYLVMEHLDGETIGERLLRGPLPPDQVLRFASEIADALARAHRQGIVHRDLKPHNVMLTKSGAKLLDFGLAKLREGDADVAAAGGSMMPTATRNLTTAGTLLGTFQYMAPEQLEGKDADARTDIFAFGSLVYEMTTGRRAFEGGSQASLIASIMGKDPAPMAALAPVTPPALERIVRRCLAKDPDDRWQSAGDLAHALRELAGIGSIIVSAPTSAPASMSTSGGMALPGAMGASDVAHPDASGAVGAIDVARAAGRVARRGVPPVLAAAIAIVLVAATAVAAYVLKPTAPRERLRASINLPSAMRLDNQNTPLAFSPDGRTLAICAAGSGGHTMLHLRGLDSKTTQELAGTEGASYPFWSPDGRYIGFFSDRKLKKVPAGGGTVVSLCDVVDGRGASWGAKGVIVFSPNPFGGLSQVAEAGGAPTAVTTTDQPSMTHRLPWFLPDGRHFLYFVGTVTGSKENGVHVFDLDTKKDQMLLAMESGARYTAPGWLTFVRDQNLMAQKFDASTLKLSGEAVPIAEGIRFNAARWSGTYALSDQGTLVYQVGAVGLRGQVTWFDLQGRKLSTVGQPAPMIGVAIAPDAQRAVTAQMGTGGLAELWVFDLARGVSSRLTFGAGMAAFPVWSPDSQRIAYTDGNGQILAKRFDGTGAIESLITSTDRIRNPVFWTHDGRSLIFRTQAPATGLDVEQVSTQGDHAVTPLLETPANETDPSISPDGHWLAYRSDESGGAMQLFIASHPGGGGKWQVTSGGANSYEWFPDGKRIVFETPDRKMFVVDLRVVGDRLDLSAPAPFFGGELAPESWTIAPDGKRVLAVVQVDEGPTAPLELLTDWSGGLSGS
jgi:Tol biopolymer transport system component